MKLLLTDATNALGRALEHELEREPFGLIALSSARPDWTDLGEVRACLDHQPPKLVINTLGWADRPDTAQCALIATSAATMATVCHERGIPMIQLSSYQVFGGDNKSTHAERDEPSPQSEAGRAWLAAEEAVNEALAERVVLRLSWLIDSHGNNRLTRLLQAIFENRELVANTRLRGAPTALSDVARVLVGVIKQISCGAQNWGVMHYASREACTEAEFVDRVVEVLRQLDTLPDTLSKGMETTDSLPSDEPVSAVLAVRRLRDGFGVQQRSWEPYLVPMIKQWLHDRTG
ncbi:sugar nucleotide-binding protein [Marinimicrobium agarilyticum]|uniref:sugar nucleotide-binding protein n=1 Tax=Marinimicrobium agarilyticum TaxID=306546 RepID=UPI000402A3B5|nr:sugar nucleotide-binding protein [Marinimicrobium agarilyticum]